MSPSLRLNETNQARNKNWWAISALIVLAAYLLVCVITGALWAAVGFELPNVMGPETPSIASRTPPMIAGLVLVGSVLATLAAVALSIVGLVRPQLPRRLAIVALGVSCLALVPTVFVGIFGGLLALIYGV